MCPACIAYRLSSRAKKYRLNLDRIVIEASQTPVYVVGIPCRTPRPKTEEFETTSFVAAVTDQAFLSAHRAEGGLSAKRPRVINRCPPTDHVPSHPMFPRLLPHVFRASVPTCSSGHNFVRAGNSRRIPLLAAQLHSCHFFLPLPNPFEISG